MSTPLIYELKNDGRLLRSGEVQIVVDQKQYKAVCGLIYIR